jgi:hypothetical protein
MTVLVMQALASTPAKEDTRTAHWGEHCTSTTSSGYRIMRRASQVITLWKVCKGDGTFIKQAPAKNSSLDGCS